MTPKIIIGGTRILLSTLSICFFLGIGCSAGTLCKRTKPNCYGSDCIEEIKCEHGICDSDGHCQCLPCYSGSTCIGYDDKYGPRFAIHEDTVIIDPEHSGVVHKASAEDEDLGLTCPLGPGLNTRCPCATIHYSLSPSDPLVQDFFYIHESSGQIFLRPGAKLIPGQQYRVKILASGKDIGWNNVDVLTDEQVLTVMVHTKDRLTDMLLNQKDPFPESIPQVSNKLTNPEKDFHDEDGYDVEHEAYDDEKYDDQYDDGAVPPSAPLIQPETLARRKREASGLDMVVGDSRLTLTELTTPSDPVQPGESIDYKLDIVLPILSSPIDLLVEVFVRDPVSGISPYALCDLRVDHVGEKILDENDQAIDPNLVNIESFTNAQFGTFYDRGVINFGNVKNTDVIDGSNDFSPSTITVLFTAILIDNPDYVNDTAIVTAGAEYNNEQYVWVGQAKNNCQMGPPNNFGITGTVTPASANVAQWSGTTFTFDSYFTHPFGTLELVIFSDNAIADLVSISQVQVLNKGAALSCTNLDFLEMKNYKTATNRTDYKRILSLPILMKGLDYNSLTPSASDPSIQLSFGFNVFVHDATEGMTVKIGVGVFFEDVSIYIDSVTITVTAPVAPSTSPPTWVQGDVLTDAAVPDLGTATFGITATIPDGGGAHIDCTIPGVADQKVCGVMYGDVGGKIAFLPWLSPITIYGDDGGASFAVDINSTGIGTGTNDIVFEISIHYLTAARTDMTVTCDSFTYTMTATSGAAGIADMTGTVSNLITDTTWYTGSQAGLLIALTFPKGSAPYGQITLEAAGDLDVSGWGSRACTAKIVSGGRGVPCISGRLYDFNNNNVELKKGKDTSAFDDGLLLKMGSGCGTTRLTSVDKDFEVKIKVFFDIPDGQASAADGTFNISVGINIDNTRIWTGWESFTTSTTPPALPPAPTYLFNPPDSTELSPGVPTMVQLVLKTHPGSVGTYKIIISVVSSDKVSICKILFLGVGDSFPCVDTDAYFKEDIPYQRTTIIHDAPQDWGKSAVVDLGTLRNVGGDTIDTGNIADDDTILLGVLVKGVALGGADTLTAVIDSTGTSITQPLTVSTVEPNTGSINVTILGTDGTNDAYEDVMKMVDIILTVAPGYGQLLKVKVTNPTPGEISLCHAGVFVVGDNIPCLLPSTVIPVKTSTDTEEVYEIDLLHVCHFHASDEPTANDVVVRVGATFLPTRTVDSASLGIVVTEGTTDLAQPDYSFSLTSAAYTMGPVTTSNLRLELVDNDTMTVEPGMRIHVGIALTLAPFQTVPIEIGVMTPSDGGRAYATVHGLKFGRYETLGVSKNLGCLLDDCTLYEPRIFQNSSLNFPMLHESQTDTMVVNLGYVTNTGLSHLHKTNIVQNDQAWIEVDLWFADHPNATDGSTITVSFAAKVADVILVIDKPFTVSKTGTYAPVIVTKLFLTDNSTTLFNHMDQIGCTLQLYHSVNESTAEANDATVRVFFSKYVVFDNTTNIWQANLTGNMSGNNYIDYNIGYLFFTDILEVNFTATVDPGELMQKGLGVVNATTISRIVCSTNYETALKYCGTTSQVQYQLNAEDCFEDLNTDAMDDCQFSASTAIDVSKGPAMAKFSSTGWMPAVRTGQGWSPYITVDFLKKTRVTQIEFATASGCRAVTKFRMQYSHSGVLFSDACLDDITVPPDGMVTLDMHCRFTARYGRVLILDGDGDATGQAYGLTFNWFGCPRESVDDVCNPIQTTLTDQTSGWRHVALDTEHDIFYFCDYSPLKKRVLCYSSADGGKTWNANPSYIGRLVGFDADTNKMYAMDNKERAMVSSDDGVNWAVVDSTTSAAVVSRVVPPSAVPGNPSTTLVPVIMGSWAADFTGVMYNGGFTAKWSSCCG